MVCFDAAASDATSDDDLNIERSIRGILKSGRKIEG